MKALKAFIKPFEAPQRSVKPKISHVFPLRPGLGWEGLIWKKKQKEKKGSGINNVIIIVILIVTEPLTILMILIKITFLKSLTQ